MLRPVSRAAGSALAALFASLAPLCGALADAPTATVPANLQGDWQAFFGGLGPVTVQLTDRAATIVSDRKETLGFLNGTFSSSGQMTLKVLWDLPAFQQNSSNALPAIVWPDAVLDKGDFTYPGYVGTVASLHYDPQKDELSGSYTALKIIYHPDTIKYDKTETSSVAITLTRPKEQLLHVALTINDRISTTATDALVKQIQDLEKRIDDQRHALTALRSNYDAAKTQFDKTDADFTTANNKKRVSQKGVIYFAQIAANEDEAKTKAGITALEKQIADYDGSHTTADENRNFMGEVLNYAKQHLADIQAGHRVVYPHPENPKNELDQEMKRFIDAVNQLQTLDGTWREQLSSVSDLGDKVEAASKALAGDNRALTKLNSTLYTSAMNPTIQQVDVAIGGSLVYSAVYDPAVACLNQQLLDVQRRIDNDAPYYNDLLATKEDAFKQLRAEGEAAVATGKRLAGNSRFGIYFSDIMLSAYIQRGAEVAASLYDLAKASKEGGPYGVLAEALKQETDFAIKYVASGGEDVGYTGVDEKAMEAAARANLNPVPDTWSAKVDRFGKKSADSAIKWGKDKAETFVPDTLNAAALKGSLQQAIIDKGKAPIASGDGACDALKRTLQGAVSNERERQDQLKRLRAALSSTYKGGTLAARAKKVAEGAKTSIIKGGLKAGATALANYWESGIWVEYFEHDLRARALFQIWQQAAQLWDAEYDYFNGLLEEQKQLLAQQKPGQLIYREAVNYGFPTGATARDMTVSAKASVPPTAQVAGNAAKAGGNGQFTGTVAAGSQPQNLVKVEVTAQAP